jgi:hypothetical protein
VDENVIGGGELILAEQTFQRRPCDVHEIERAGEFYQFRSMPKRRPLSRTAPDETTSPTRRSPLDHPKAGVVTGLGVCRAWVSQS